MSPRIISIHERFWKHVLKTETCWLWQAAKLPSGYGRFGRGGHDGGVELAHRMAWTLTYGPIPDGLYVCHLCDMPECCRPDHLFLGTPKRNIHDMIAKKRHAHGERQRHTLSTADVLAIRGSSESRAALAARYGVSKTHIDKIIWRQRWAHL